MNSVDSRWLIGGALSVLVISTAGLWFLPETRPLSTSRSSAPSLASTAPESGNAASAADHGNRASKPSETLAISTADRVRIEVELQKCRDVCVTFEGVNAEVLVHTEKFRVVRLHPPTGEQLDDVHNAITKGVAAFSTNPGAENQFRKEALGLIAEFGIFKNQGRLVIFRPPTEGKEEAVSIVEFADADTMVKAEPDGSVSLTGPAASTKELKDWNEPESPSHRRFVHLTGKP